MFGIHVHRTDADNKPCNSEESFKILNVARNYNLDIRSAQIFVCGAKSYNGVLSDEDKIFLRKQTDNSNFALIVHGSYADNPWNNIHGTIHNIREELRTAVDIGARGVIVHLGASTNDNYERVLSRIDENLKFELSDDNYIHAIRIILYLEINAIKPSINSFETPAKIKALFDKIKRLKFHSITIGLCIDTAHLYSCGTSLETYDAAKAFLKAMPENIPLMIHLNDSASALGSGIDKHAPVGEGNIWGKFGSSIDKKDVLKSGICAIHKFSKKTNTVVILERAYKEVEKDFINLSRFGFFN